MMTALAVVRRLSASREIFRFGYPGGSTRRALKIPPGRKIDVQLLPEQETGSTPVTKFEDPRIALVYVAKRMARTETGRYGAKSVTFNGAIPPNTGTVSIGV